MSEEDEGLALRSERIVTMVESEGNWEQIEESVEELHARVLELQQKLAISEQAVEDKNEELNCDTQENTKNKAAADVEHRFGRLCSVGWCLIYVLKSFLAQVTNRGEKYGQ